MTAETGNWQRFLRALDIHDYEGRPLVVDESFGPRTAHATRVYQAARRLPETGRLDEATRERAVPEGFIPFIQAANQTVLYPKERTLDVLVLHTMEAPETMKTAENVAKWFAGPSAPKASAHYCVDADSVVQCVRDMDVAWHAPGANHNGIGIEMAGYAGQTPTQWDDAYSRALLTNVVSLTARLVRAYRIPVVRLSVNELKLKGRGLCGHVDVTNAFSKGKGHWDPGPSFPWDLFLARLAEAV